MTSLLAKYVPTTTGGSRFGLSFLKSWFECPYRAACQYLMPHPDGRGLQAHHKARPLIAGGLFHAAIEPWYVSRCINKSTGEFQEDNGQPDLEYAQHVLDTWAAQHSGEWEDPIERDTDTQLCRDWLLRYHNHYGPQGVEPDWPNLKVYVDETGPWVEREVVLPLAEGLEATCRIDLIASDLGHPVVVEHKTTSASYYFSLLRSMHIAAQPSMELLCLREAAKLPFLPTACVVNVLNKNPGRAKDAKTPPFGRERVSRTEQEIDHFRRNLMRWLGTIERWLEEFEKLCGTDPEPRDVLEAIGTVFPRTGTLTGQCYTYSRPCEMWPICASTGREAVVVNTYRARYRDGSPTQQPIYEEETSW